MDIKTSLGDANISETERCLRESFILNEGQFSASIQSLTRDCQGCFNNYHQSTSLYLALEIKDRNKLIIYDTESEKEEIKTFDTPKSLDFCTCITQIPNGELFCFGSYRYYGATWIIDKDYKIRHLPSGSLGNRSSSIYFNNNIYCFGGWDKEDNALTLSRKFYIKENRWMGLAPIPDANYFCSSVVFKGNILISGKKNKNLWLYSIDIDSFSTIPYDFMKGKRKILISIDRLYLIECGWSGLIYESEDEYNWKQISNSYSRIRHSYPHQVYYLYNKGSVYISAAYSSCTYKFYKFDMSRKLMLEFDERCSTWDPCK